MAEASSVDPRPALPSNDHTGSRRGAPTGLGSRQFTADRPNQLWVAEITYVATWRGFLYVAFDALAGALRAGPRAGRAVGASQRPRRAISGDSLHRAVGGSRDSYVNALAERVIGLFKTEEIHRRGAWNGLEDVEFAMLEWVTWYNHQRLLEPLGYVPPAKFEQAYQDRQAAPGGVAVLT